MPYVRVRMLMGILVLAGLVGIPMGTSARAEEAVPLEVIEVLEQPETPSDSGPAVVRFRILDGSRAGDTVTYRHQLWGHPSYDPDFRPGTVFMGSLSPSDGPIERLRLGQPRKHYILGALFLLLTVLLVLVAGWEGLAGLICSSVTLGLVLWFFFPIALTGGGILAAGLALCVLTIVISIPLILGGSRPTLPAVGSLITVTGVLFLLARWGLDFLHLNPGEVRHSRLILTELNRMTGDAQQALTSLLVTGIVVGTLGAMMDVAVVISSTINEITRDTETVSMGEAFRSGMTVGREILSTMVNTLLFAYLGVLLPFFLAIEVFDVSLLRLMNYSFVGVEILRIAVGLVGLSLIIPVTALVAAWWSR